jgi:hypothetical protein
MAWDFSNTSWDYKESLISVEKDTDDSGVEELQDPKYRSFIEKTYSVIKDVEHIGLPKPGEQLRVVTYRTFNAAVFLSHIAEKEDIEYLILVVYSINAEAAKLINSLINSGKIKKAKILMSNLRNKAHREKEQVTRDIFVNNPNVDLFFAQCHSKIMAMQTTKGNYYSVEGSGNLSFNSRIEQYIIDNDKGLFDFTDRWTEDIKTYLKGKKELVLT